jgi:hypothetical protein
MLRQVVPVVFEVDDLDVEELVEGLYVVVVSIETIDYVIMCFL